MLDNVQMVVAAVSGGVDSMAMLDLLLTYRQRHRIEITVVHFNHQLRGAEADRDEELVRKFCQERSLDFFRDTADVRSFARAEKISLEMAGRELRYAFFNRIAGRYTDSVIATAHTLDDQAETILLRLLKGSGLQGLSGINYQRENVIRPLLFATKAELYTYARLRQLPFVEDHTNSLSDCERNIVRNRLLPEIKRDLNSNIVRTLTNLGENMAEARQVIVESALAALPDLTIVTDSAQIVLDKSGLKTYFIGIEKEIIWQCLQRLTDKIQPLSHRQMNTLINMINTGSTGRSYAIDGGILVMNDRERLILQRTVNADWPETDYWPGQTIDNEFFMLTSEPLEAGQYRRPARHSAVEYFDLDKLGDRLRLRHWQAGDRLTPLGMSQSRKLSDIFIDLKIPRLRKSQIPLLISGDRIVWICGLTPADEFKITSTTKTALKIIYKDKRI